MSLKVDQKYGKTERNESFNTLSDRGDNRLESPISDIDLKSQPDRKLFVGGLTSETSEKNLNDYFKTFGDVVSCAVKIFRDTGISRGFGFVVFKEEEAVKKVLSISEHKINGKKIDPKPAKCNKDTQKKVFVGGLDPEITANQIEEHFTEFGKVEAVDLPYDNTRGRRKNYVFVVFSTESEAKKAASIERQIICGKVCDVRVAVPRELSLRNRCQQPIVNWQQAIWNLFYGQNHASNLLLQNQLALSGSLNYLNLLNQRLTYPIRPDASNLTSAAAGVNFNNNFHGPDFAYLNNTNRLPAANFVPGNAKNFNPILPSNPAISNNRPLESWNLTNNADTGIQPEQQDTLSAGKYIAPVSTQNSNGIPTIYGYPVQSASNCQDGSPYSPFTHGYQFPNVQSSVPYFYSVGLSGPPCYLAAGPNGNIYQPIVINHQPANGDQAGNDSSSSSFLVNAGYQTPFGNDFLTMLTPNQVNLPFIAYQTNPATDMLGLPYRQPARDSFAQTPDPETSSDYVGTFPFYNPMMPSDPVPARPLIYGLQAKSSYSDPCHKQNAPRFTGRSAHNSSLGSPRFHNTFARGQNSAYPRSRNSELLNSRTDFCTAKIGDAMTQPTSPEGAVGNDDGESKPSISAKTTDWKSKLTQDFECENSSPDKHRLPNGLPNGIESKLLSIDLSSKSAIS